MPYKTQITFVFKRLIQHYNLALQIKDAVIGSPERAQLTSEQGQTQNRLSVGLVKTGGGDRV
jgi:hypothetical protein